MHRDVYDRFVDGLAEFARSYRLDDPTDPATTLGPLVRPAAAEFVRGQIAEAVAAGAKAHLDPKSFPKDLPGSAYMAPEAPTGVDHTMRIITEETFGPAVGVMPVASDDEAIRLMNDCRYGLTAAIWTNDLDAAIRIGDRVATGTWFMNRCDYLYRRSPGPGSRIPAAASRSHAFSTSASPVRSHSICARPPDLQTSQPLAIAVHRTTRRLPAPWVRSSTENGGCREGPRRACCRIASSVNRAAPTISDWTGQSCH